jgi:hypothetical protein
VSAGRLRVSLNARRSEGSSRSLGRWPDSDVEPVPLVVFARGDRSTARKGPVQHLNVGDLIQIQPPPIRQRPTARAGNLKGKESHVSMLHAIVVRFYDPVSTPIPDSNQARLVNRNSE